MPLEGIVSVTRDRAPEAGISLESRVRKQGSPRETWNCEKTAMMRVVSDSLRRSSFERERFILGRNPMAIAQVKAHHDAPTLFINGSPTFAGVHWAPTPPEDPAATWEGAASARAFADAGVRIKTIGVGAGSEWRRPVGTEAIP